MAKTFKTVKELTAFLKKVKSPKHLAPSRTGAPYLVENNYANTVDLHVASTNFVSLVDDFANELSTCLAWDFTHGTNDPIMKQVEFFKQLNDGQYVPTGPTGGKDKLVRKDITVAIDTKIRSNEKIAFDEGGVPVTRIKNNLRQYKIISMMPPYNDRWINIEKKIINEIKRRTKSLKSKYGYKDMKKTGDEFVLFWIERFRVAHDTVKAAVLEQVQEKHWYQPLCDSIGSIIRMDRKLGWNLSSLDIPQDDVTYSKSVSPISYSPIIGDKIDTVHQRICQDFSDKTAYVFRANMRMTKTIGARSDKPHGEDLVPDSLHWKRMTGGGDRSQVQALRGKINDALGDVSSVLAWLRTSIKMNNQIVMNPKIEYSIENAVVRVDAYKNLINPTTKKTRTKYVIGTDINPRGLGTATNPNS
jgi:hypothetical protein